MKRNFYKKMIGLTLSFGAVLSNGVSASYAQTIPTTVANPTGTFGASGITNLSTLLAYVFNLFKYLGWAGVFIGIAFVIFSLIYKLMNAENEEAIKKVQGYITKAVLIVLAGLLLLSLGFIIQLVANTLGYGGTVSSNPFTTATPDL